MAIETFHAHMRRALDADARYSKTGSDIDSDKVMDAIMASSTDELKACFPQVWDLILEMATLETRRIRLRLAYSGYMTVKICYEERLGYRMTYINDVEMARAKRAVAAIERSALDKDPSLDKDTIWQSLADDERLNTLPHYGITRDHCQRVYKALVNTAPYEHPAKDF